MNNGPADPEARAMFIQAQRNDPTYVCSKCGHYWNGYTLCPKCRSRAGGLAYPWAFDWDPALLAYVKPHELCETAKAGRPCSCDCDFCQWAGHDTIVVLPSDDDGVPF